FKNNTTGSVAKPNNNDLPPAYQKIEDTLASHFSTKVKMIHNKKGYGSITIEYYSLDELNKILDQMNITVS
ncbi:hypothetical protein, partial [Streptomyces scabiei]|uniref:hypothetical protein n=1 Tax=Streptomyces scabiei TaxID=1930 RepID=UPI0038F6F03F